MEDIYSKKALMDKITGLSIVGIEEHSSLNQTVRGSITMWCGDADRYEDEDEDGGSKVLILSDGSRLVVWSSEWGGLTWYTSDRDMEWR